MFDDSGDKAWQLRYGSEKNEVADPLTRFLNHRSVRDFSDESVPEVLVEQLIAAAQSASTSSNLQLWSVISVQDPVRRSRIAELCADQKQVHNAPWFFAFLADHHRMREVAAQSHVNPEGLAYEEFYVMALIDVALAAERMVCAAESVGLGVCYIGAMRNHPREISDLLNLPKGIFAPFGLCLGYPADDCEAKIKPRLAQHDIWFREQYQSTVDVSDYDRRMSEFYIKEGMKGDVTWSMRSARRVDGSARSMSGRDTLKDWIQQIGFSQR